jgi:hypothetical protein
MLSRGVVMLHDNARSHTAAATQDLIATFCWEQFDHPPSSPDLAPIDFHVLLYLKTFLGGRWFHDGDEVKEAVNTLLRRRRHHSTMQGYRNWCLNNGGNYVETSVMYTSNGNVNDLEIFFFNSPSELTFWITHVLAHWYKMLLNLQRKWLSLLISSLNFLHKICLTNFLPTCKLISYKKTSSNVLNHLSNNYAIFVMYWI